MQMNQQDQNQAPIGAPQVQVILPDKLGGQKVEEVQVDSNRIGPVAEQRAIWLEGLAIPPRAEDILIQSACWIGGSGFACSVLRVLPPMVELLVPIVALLLVGLAVTAYAWARLAHLRPFIIYRAILISIGLAMGVLL